MIEIIDGRLVATKKLRGKMVNVALELIDMMYAQGPVDHERVFLVRSSGLPLATGWSEPPTASTT